MSLNLTGTATPGIATLHPDWAPKLRAYALLRDQQQAADAEARAAKAAADAAKDEILTALAGAAAATCGNLVVTVKTGNPAPAALTTESGQKIPWDKVTGLTIGNAYVDAKEIKTIFGGRAGSVSVQVAG